MNQIPAKFISTIDRVKELASSEIYIAALLFGSAARGELTDESDLDVIVITDEKHGTTNILHPVVDGVKLDISFNTFKHFKENIQNQIDKGERVPMIVEAVILFDKTGEVTKYKESLKNIVPPELSKEDQKFQVFMLLHINSKIKKFMEKHDYTQAAVAMHYALPDLMKRHYRLQHKWRVSDKRLLADLKTWDAELADFVEKFVTESKIEAKYEIWKQILENVSKVSNTSQSFEETNCDCDTCRVNLNNLASL